VVTYVIWGGKLPFLKLRHFCPTIMLISNPGLSFHLGISLKKRIKDNVDKHSTVLVYNTVYSTVLCCNVLSAEFHVRQWGYVK